MVPGPRRTAYKFVGSRGSPPIHQTRALRLGTADLHQRPGPLLRSPAQPSEGDAGGGEPQGRCAPPAAVALRAILDLHPPPCPATFMVGTWRNRGGDGSLP